MKKLFLILLLAGVTFAQSSGYGFMSETITAANDSILSSSLVIDDSYNSVALGFATDDSLKIEVTTYYGITGKTGAFTYATKSLDTLTTTSNTGAFLNIILRGYNSAGSYVNGIPAANRLQFMVKRLTGSAVSAEVVGRLMLIK
jgi:hypothetical protein